MAGVGQLMMRGSPLRRLLKKLYKYDTCPRADLLDDGQATACQGRTECGNTRKEDGDWWLELYVMLSRATRLDDLLLLRAPPSSFLLQGPPPDLQKRLQSFAARTKKCRAHAEKLARELGFSSFLH